MFCLAAFLAGLAFGAGPTGHYVGTKSVLGNSIVVDINSHTPGYFSLKVTGSPGGNVHCPKERYLVKGDELTMPNMGKAGDCAHDQFKAASLHFMGGIYNEAADTITVKSRYLFLTVTVTCHKVSATDVLQLPKLLAVPEVQAVPTGHYYGTKTVLGNHIKVNMETVSDGVFSLSITGGPSGDINCPQEAYEIDGDEITMPNYKTEGDCAHDQFKAAKLKFKSGTYDAAEDTITVKAKYLFLTVKVVLTKASVTDMVAAEPTGHYMGTKTVLGYHVTVDMTTGDAGMFSLKVSGAPGGNVDCPKEAYLVTGDELTMPNYQTEGDCAHDQFKAASLKFEGATYNAADDTITVKSKYLFITVHVTCKKQAFEIDGESTAPLQRILDHIEAAA